MKKEKSLFASSISLFLSLFLVSAVFAEDQAPTYSGDLWTRPTLTGDWGGLRNDLARKGVTFDMSLTQIGMGVISGGKDIAWEYSGVGNMTMHIAITIIISIKDCPFCEIENLFIIMIQLE